MREEMLTIQNNGLVLYKEPFQLPVPFAPGNIFGSRSKEVNDTSEITLPGILFITSYPPRECGIATYSHDLIKALHNKFRKSFSIKVCALEPGVSGTVYPLEVGYLLDTTDSSKYSEMSRTINKDKSIDVVLIEHEFGFFERNEISFLEFLNAIVKPVIVCFHTVLPRPDEALKGLVQKIASACQSVIVMTNNSATILTGEYEVPAKKISVIAHGTHLVLHESKDLLKRKHQLTGRKVLSTFGLLSSGKSIETTLDALPAVIHLNPDVIFLIIGKTHPGVLSSEGEKYRDMLKAKVEELNLHQHVRFINRYLPLEDLLEYLQLTDIYLFTSKDPNQAVSGTFAYAMSCACPIISTPIPHAKEVLSDDTGIIFDFQNSGQLSESIIRLLNDEVLLNTFTSNTLQRIAPTAWENSAVAHALLLENISGHQISLQYRLPEINLAHIKKMSTDFGLIQFSKINQPDIESGFTLDDNARALIAISMHYELTGDQDDLRYMNTYLDFMNHCQQAEGYFLNYADRDKKFTEQNNGTNLADANGRAIWALGYLISHSNILPAELVLTAETILQKALLRVVTTHSTRAMAFAIKGIYYYNQQVKSPENLFSSSCLYICTSLFASVRMRNKFSGDFTCWL